MKGQTRREFIGRGFSGIALAGAGLMARPLLSLAANPGQLTPGAVQRNYTAGKFGLEIDGQFAGWVEHMAGGHAISDVVTEKLGSDLIQRKHVGAVKYEDVVVNCGIGMSASYYEWIKASLAGRAAPKNGAVVTCDYNGKEYALLNWFNAVITEIGFPACDAGSKDAAMMTLKFAPEYTRTTVRAGGGVSSPYKYSQAIPKKWLPSNFRLQIDGLDCSRVHRVEAITAKTPYSAIQSRALPGEALGRPQGQVSNLVVTLPEAGAETFYRWHQSFIVEGRNGAAGEKSGKLEYLTPNDSAVLFAMTFQHLGILKLTPLRVASGASAVREVQVEMYCRSLGFESTVSAWA